MPVCYVYLSMQYYYLVLPAELMITPESATVAEGGFVTFNCIFRDSTEAPAWIINGSSYSSENLRQGVLPRYSYSDGTLNFGNVTASDNGTTYQCVILPYASDIATLTVVPKGL